jgi:hypothetical protein
MLSPIDIRHFLSCPKDIIFAILTIPAPTPVHNLPVLLTLEAIEQNFV